MWNAIPVNTSSVLASREREPEPGLDADVTVGQVGPLQHFVHIVLLVHEAGPGRKELLEAVGTSLTCDHSRSRSRSRS